MNKQSVTVLGIITFAALVTANHGAYSQTAPGDFKTEPGKAPWRRLTNPS